MNESIKFTEGQTYLGSLTEFVKFKSGLLCAKCYLEIDLNQFSTTRSGGINI